MSKEEEASSETSSETSSEANSEAGTEASSEASSKASSWDYAHMEAPNSEDATTELPRRPLFLKRNKRASCRTWGQEGTKIAKFTDYNNAIELDSSPHTATATATATSTATTTTTVGESGTNADSVNSPQAPLCGKRIVSVAGMAPREIYMVNDRSMIVNYRKIKLFKLNALRKAKMSHLKVTQRKQKNLQTFVQKWLADHVSGEEQQQCNDWLLGKTTTTSTEAMQSHTTTATTPAATSTATTTTTTGAALKTKVVQQNDLKKTPYRIYNRYKVQATTPPHNAQQDMSPMTKYAAAAVAVDELAALERRIEAESLYRLLGPE